MKIKTGIKPLIAIILAFTLLYTQGLHTALEASISLWNHRKSSYQKLNKFQQNFHHIKPQKLSKKLNVNLDKYNLPPNSNIAKYLNTISPDTARIKKVKLSQNYKVGDPVVLLIQDAHGNVSTQKNIDKILRNMISEKGSEKLLVGIEGARGAFNFEPYRRLPNRDNTRNIGEHLVEKGWITGAELTGMSLEPGDSTVFWGVEDEQLYLDHVEAFKKAIKRQNDVNKILLHIEDILKKKKNKITSFKLKKLHLKRKQYEKGKIDLENYIIYLIGASSRVAVRNKKQIRRFIESIKLNRKIEWRRLDKYEKDYRKYINISENIDFERLTKEIRESERELTQNFGDKDRLMEKVQNFSLMKKLCNVNLTSEEWGTYVEIKPGITKWITNMNLGNHTDLDSGSSALKGLVRNDVFFVNEEFNRKAIKRNPVMLRNLLNKGKDIKTQTGKLPTMLLISGGFHNNGLEKILTQKRISYAVLVPKLKSNTTNVTYTRTKARECFASCHSGRRTKGPESRNLGTKFPGETITLSPQSVMVERMIGDGMDYKQRFINKHIAVLTIILSELDKKRANQGSLMLRHSGRGPLGPKIRNPEAVQVQQSIEDTLTNLGVPTIKSIHVTKVQDSKITMELKETNASNPITIEALVNNEQRIKSARTIKIDGHKIRLRRIREPDPVNLKRYISAISNFIRKGTKITTWKTITKILGPIDTLYEKLFDGHLTPDILDLLNEHSYQDPKLEKEINHQNPNAKLNSIPEAVANGLDAMGLTIGKFGKGIKQILSWLTETGDRIEVYSYAKGEKPYYIFITLDEDNEFQINLKRGNKKYKKEGTGTTVIVKKKTPIPEESEEGISLKKIEDEVHRQFIADGVEITTHIEGQPPRKLNSRIKEHEEEEEKKEEFLDSGSSALTGLVRNDGLVNEDCRGGACPLPSIRNPKNFVNVHLSPKQITIINNGKPMNAQEAARMFVPKYGSKSDNFIKDTREECNHLKVILCESKSPKVSFASSHRKAFQVDIAKDVVEDAVVKYDLVLDLGRFLHVQESWQGIVVNAELNSKKVSDMKLAITHIIDIILRDITLDDREKLRRINSIAIALEKTVKSNKGVKRTVRLTHESIKGKIETLLKEFKRNNYVILPHKKTYAQLNVGDKVIYLHPNLFEWRGVEDLREKGGRALPDVRLKKNKKEVIVFDFKEESLNHFKEYDPNNFDWLNWSDNKRAPQIKENSYIVVPRQAFRNLEVLLDKEELSEDENKQYNQALEQLTIWGGEKVLTSYEDAKTTSKQLEFKRKKVVRKDEKYEEKKEESIDDKAVKGFLTNLLPQPKDFCLRKKNDAVPKNYYFSPKGDIIVVTYRDSTIKLYNSKDNKEIPNFKSEKIYGVKFSPTGDRFVARDSDGTAKLYDSYGNEIATLTSKYKYGYYITFSPSSNRFVIRDLDGTVKLYNYQNGREIPFTQNNVLCIVSSPSGDKFFVRYWDDTAKLYNYKTGREIPIPTQKGVRYITFSPTGDRFVIEYDNHTAIFYDNYTATLYDSDNRAISEFQNTSPTDKATYFTPTGDRFIVKHSDHIALYDSNGRKISKLPSMPPRKYIHFSPAGDRFVAEHYNDTVKLYDSKDGREIKKIRKNLKKVAFSPSGDRFVIIYTNGTAKFYDSQDGRKIKKLGKNIEKVEFSSDGNKLIIMYEDGHTKIGYMKTIDKKDRVLPNPLLEKRDLLTRQIRNSYSDILELYTPFFRFIPLRKKLQSILSELYRSQENEICSILEKNGGIKKIINRIKSGQTMPHFPRLIFDHFETAIVPITESLKSVFRSLDSNFQHCRELFFGTLIEQLFKIASNNRVKIPPKWNINHFKALGLGFSVEESKDMELLDKVADLIKKLEYGFEKKSRWAHIRQIVQIINCGKKKSLEHRDIVLKQLNRLLEHPEFINTLAETFSEVDEKINIQELNNDYSSLPQLARAYATFLTEEVDILRKLAVNKFKGREFPLPEGGITLSQLNILAMDQKDHNKLVSMGQLYSRLKLHSKSNWKTLLKRRSKSRWKTLPKPVVEEENHTVRNITVQRKAGAYAAEAVQNSIDGRDEDSKELPVLHVRFYKEMGEDGKMQYVEEIADEGKGAEEELLLLIEGSTKDGLDTKALQRAIAGYFGVGKFTYYEGVNRLEFITCNGEKAYRFIVEVTMNELGNMDVRVTKIQRIKKINGNDSSGH